MKKKYLIIFLIISGLIFAYLIFLLNFVGTHVDYNFFSEGEYPSKEIQKSVLKYVYPALCIYILNCIFFAINKVKPKKIIYPIAIIILYFFINIIGVFKSGGSAIWMVFFTFIPMIFLIALSIIIGNIQDKKY